MESKLPQPADVFKAVFGVHLLSAVWNIVSDCDETYNYWEPMHYLINGRGFQTWEYAPQYGLRSYLYIWLYTAPAFIAKCVGLEGRGLFYLTRIYMALIAAGAETYLYSVLKTRYRSILVSVFTLLFLSFSAGSFIASTAFLPSSFAMYLATVLLAAWIDRNYKIAVACVACSAVIGWPFSAALGLPLLVDMILIRKRVCQFAKYAVFSGIIFAVPLVLVDTYYFGKLVIAPLNILMYNVFGGHGSQLYGTEPWTYYVKNYILNFNVAFLLSCLTPVLLLVSQDSVRLERKRMFLYYSPFIVWNVIFIAQPHKEERFLFPVYPFLAFGASVSLCSISSFLASFQRSQRLIFSLRAMLNSFVVCIFLLLSVSRIFLLLLSYSAPLNAYGHLGDLKFADDNKNISVCVGREWYRFPSQFFLPDKNWELKFIRSEFRGQLPATYDNRWGNATRMIHQHFNDLNEEVASRYWPLDSCDVIIDRESDRETDREPRYSKMSGWEVVARWDFLDADLSPAAYRTFYIPFFFWRKNHFVPYQVLRRKH